MQYSIINYSELERTIRLDGEFYELKYLEIIGSLQRVITQPITRLCKVSDGNHISIADYFQENQGIPYYRGQDINTDFFLENANPVYIPKEIYDRGYMKRSYFKTGDVLLSIVGTIGSLSLITDQIKQSTGSCKLAILRPQKIDAKYLSAFLMCKYGNLQIKRNTRGAVQTGLLLQDMDQINVFIPNIEFEKSINQLIEKAILKNRDAKFLFSQAEQILLSELNLQNWKLKHRLSFVKNYSDTQTSARIDSEYFQPMYEKILNRSKGEIKTFFSNEIFVFKRGDFIDRKYYTTERTKRAYIRIKELSNSSGINSNQVIYIGDNCKDGSQNTLKEYDIVMAIIGDTIGKSNLILKEYEGSFFSNNTGRFRLRTDFKSKFDPFYLETLFHSIYIQSQIQRAKAQTGQPKISDSEIKKILIPCIDLGKQKRISQNIQKALDSNNLSKQLLDIAKYGVEMAIEKDEKQAQNWMGEELKCRKLNIVTK